MGTPRGGLKDSSKRREGSASSDIQTQSKYSLFGTIVLLPPIKSTTTSTHEYPPPPHPPELHNKFTPPYKKPQLPATTKRQPKQKMDTQGSNGHEFSLYQNNRLSLAMELLQVLEKLEYYLILTSEYPSTENEIECEDGSFRTLIPNHDLYTCCGFSRFPTSDYEKLTGLTHLYAVSILDMQRIIF